MSFQLLKKKYNISNGYLIVFVLISNLSFSQNINAYDLLITEIMCDPAPVVGLPEDEFIEVYNNSIKSVDLSEITIQIGTKLFVPESVLLEPDSFIVFWDNDIPTLKNGGDSIKIISNNNLIHRVDYTPSMHNSSYKSNGGWSLELIDFKKPCLTKNNWSSSVNNTGGTPGSLNSINDELNPPPIELLSYCPVNDSQLNLVFSVPIQALETTYDYSTKLNEALIKIPKLDSNSIDSILISHTETCYESFFEEKNIKYGLPLNPDSGDIIINELLFNPDENGSDFIEIFNASNKSVDVSKLSFCKKNGNDELETPFALSENPFLLLPQKYCVVCSNKTWLMHTFPKSKNILVSSLPSMNNDAGHIVLIHNSGLKINETSYQDEWHFSELTNHENVSLEKINPMGLNIYSNWSSSSSSENYATPGYQNANFVSVQKSINHFELTNSIISPNGDGFNDQLSLQYNLPDIQWTAKINIINHFGVSIHTISANILLGKNGVINWDGDLKENGIIRPGIYALHIDAYNMKNQQKIKKKIPFYVNGTLQ